MKSAIPSPSESRLPTLEGLRGVAILLVLIHHLVAARLVLEDWPAGGWYLKILSLTWSGVDLFFVLSGFLIAGILLDHRREKRLVITFIIRRAVRLLPLYYVWLGLYGIILWRQLPDMPADWRWILLYPVHPFWSYFCLVQDFFVARRELFGALWLLPTWSLAVEIKFYFLAVLTLFFVPSKKLPWVLGGVIVAMPLLRGWLYMVQPTLFTYTFLPARLDAFSVGMSCAWLVRKQAAQDWLRRHLKSLRYFAGFLFCGGLAMGWGPLASRNSFEMAIFGYTWIAMLFGCALLLCVLDQAGYFTKVMRNSFLRYCGGVAYGVFIMHLAIPALIAGWWLHTELMLDSYENVVIMVVAVLITFLLANLSWRFFEKPLVDWGRSFAYDAPRKTFLHETLQSHRGDVAEPGDRCRE